MMDHKIFIRLVPGEAWSHSINPLILTVPFLGYWSLIIGRNLAEIASSAVVAVSANGPSDWTSLVGGHLPSLSYFEFTM